MAISLTHEPIKAWFITLEVMELTRDGKEHSRLASTNKPAVNIVLKPANRGLTYLEGFGECLVITRRFGVKPVIDSRPGHANLVGEVLNAQDFDGVVHGVYSWWCSGLFHQKSGPVKKHMINSSGWEHNEGITLATSPSFALYGGLNPPFKVS